ncbi:MAG: hypothetical protein D6698_10015, partial [Gammaproteobacteria bacterium]
LYDDEILEDIIDPNTLNDWNIYDLIEDTELKLEPLTTDKKEILDELADELKDRLYWIRQEYEREKGE